MSLQDQDQPAPSAGGESQESSCKFQFKRPVRAIHSAQDLHAFTKSQVYQEVMTFVKLCNEAVKARTVTGTDYEVPSEIQSVVAMLDTMNGWVDEIPPIQQPMRFGNKAFRNWHKRLVQQTPGMVQGLLPPELQGAQVELLPYLLDSFGNEQRIDYGTGHETNFMVFLCCLYKLGVLKREHLCGGVLRAFDAYLRVMRRLQTVYMLEPAGSHGVWGLDDYHCLPFLWGSAQLSEQTAVPPDAIQDEGELERLKGEYLYMAAISHIKQLKQGAPFGECCPMLSDISALPSWRKVNSGMFKLYEGEVLQKFPVIQHFLFGSLLPCTWQSRGNLKPPNPPSVHGTSASQLPRSTISGGMPEGQTVAPWAKASAPAGLHISQTVGQGGMQEAQTVAPWAKAAPKPPDP